MLQHSRILKVIKKNLVKKAIDLFTETMEDDEKWKSFYQNYSKNIKLAIHEDSSNRSKLVKLLRYHTSETGDEMCSLEDYVTRMKENQKDIYYITGEGREALMNSSYVEGITKKGYEVIYMTEPIDEYCIQQLTEYEGHKMKPITKEGLELPEDEEEKKAFEEIKKGYESTCESIKNILGDKCEKVFVSNRLTNTPCCVVTGQFGWSANMERIMKAQALGDRSSMAYMTSKKNLEINPTHPIIMDLREKLKDEESKRVAGDLVNLLFDTSLINCGFVLEAPADFSNRIFNIIGLGLGLDPEEPSKEESTEESSEVNLDDMPDLEEIPGDEETKPVKNKIDKTGRIVEDTVEDEAMEQVD